MFKVLIFLCLFFVSISSADFECRDESNKPVGWYVIYKIPKIRASKNKIVQKGLAYAYITSKSNKGWTLSKKTLSDQGSIPGNTLAPLYKSGKSDILYLLYNDQPPKGSTKSTGGHAKGVVVAGKTGGYWLIHSVPNFVSVPSGKKKYSFPGNAHNNGQSFLCITLKTKDLKTVGKAIKYNELNVYNKNVPKDLEKIYPELASVAKGVKVNGKSQSIKATITSDNGQAFKIFAKTSKWNKELYTSLVAPDLKTDLVVQTWPNSRSHQKSSCSNKGHNVENIDETKIHGERFLSTKDHSKWTASASASKPWVCIGDINKDDSQYKRGGGTVCTNNKALWKAYTGSTEILQSCSGKKKKKKKGSDKVGASPMQTSSRNQGAGKSAGRFIDVVGPIG